MFNNVFYLKRSILLVATLSLLLVNSSANAVQENQNDLSSKISASYDEMALSWIKVWVEVHELEQKKEHVTTFVLARSNSHEFTDDFLKNPASNTICPELNKRCIAFVDDIAVMQTYQALDVYKRKHLAQDTETQHLFDNTNNFEDEIIISWIYGQVGQDKLPKEPDGSVKTKQPLSLTDTVYHYNSPPFSWENLWGREGYAVFRNGKLIDNIVISMN